MAWRVQNRVSPPFRQGTLFSIKLIWLARLHLSVTNSCNRGSRSQRLEIWSQHSPLPCSMDILAELSLISVSWDTLNSQVSNFPVLQNHHYQQSVDQTMLIVSLFFFVFCVGIMNYFVRFRSEYHVIVMFYEIKLIKSIREAPPKFNFMCDFILSSTMTKDPQLKPMKVSSKPFCFFNFLLYPIVPRKLLINYTLNPAIRLIPFYHWHTDEWITRCYWRTPQDKTSGEISKLLCLHLLKIGNWVSELGHSKHITAQHCRHWHNWRSPVDLVSWSYKMEHEQQIFFGESFCSPSVMNATKFNWKSYAADVCYYKLCSSYNLKQTDIYEN